MIGAPNKRGQKYWVGIVQWAPETSVLEGIADIFRKYNIDTTVILEIYASFAIRILFDNEGGKWIYAANEVLVTFQAWSQHTGVYKSKDSEATLKTRLRCALTKSRNIEYVKHLTSSDDDESFRVYRIKSDEG